MGTIRRTIVCFCILFLAISWPGGSLSAPPSVLPLLKQCSISDLDGQPQIPSGEPSYVSPLRVSLTSGASPVAQKQQLLNQATILLKELSPSPPADSWVNIDQPCNDAIKNQERILLQSLVDRLEAFKKNSVVAANPSSTPPAITKATYNSINSQYLQVRLLTHSLLTPRATQSIQPALDALYKTFVKIITGQLLNVELPNLCSKTLALNTQLKVTNAPSELQDAVGDFIKTLTTALTGQSQVTILGLCDCLNDLETSVVTVVENDKSQRLQYLLSHLVDAVTNVVAAGGDVGCNVIDVVRRYVGSMRKAVQEEANVRAGKIYSSVLNFEEELYKVLFTSEPTALTETLPSPNTTVSIPKTEEDYLTEIGRLSESIFGNRTDLVKKAVENLLSIKKLEDPEDQHISSHPRRTTTENLEKIYNLLESIDSAPQTDSTQVVETIVEALSTLPQADASKVLDALNPIPKDDNDADTPEDATDIVRDGQFFILKGQLLQGTDDHGNVIDIIQSGRYHLVNPKTNVAHSGNYVVTGGTIQSDPNGNMCVKGSGVYDVDPSENDTGTSAVARVKRQANFAIEDNVIQEVDANGNRIFNETGIFTLTNPSTRTHQSGTFIVDNIVAQRNPDGGLDVIKSGRLRVDEPGAEYPPLDDSSEYFLFSDHILPSPDSNGNCGNGIYNIRNPLTGEYQSGTYLIQQLSRTENPDGSVDSSTSGFIYADNLDPHSISDNPDQILSIVNGSQFQFNEHLAFVPDVHGNLSPISTGEFTQTDPETGRSTTWSYKVQSIMSTDNQDGSKDITRFGRFSTIIDSDPSPQSSEEPSKDNFSKRLPISRDSYQALISSLHPVKPIQPGSDPLSTDDGTYTTTERSPEVVEDPPSSNNNDDSSLKTLEQNPTYAYYDVTSLVNNGTSFIIGTLITPLLDRQGNVIGKIIMGTYHLMDIPTNTSWTGAFEATESTIEETTPGHTKLTASGTFDVTPPNTDCCSTISGEFSIEDQLSEDFYKGGSSREGTFLLTDPTTSATKFGTFVVKNTISRPKPGGAIEVVESGLLFVDQPDATSPIPSAQLLNPDDDAYFLSDEHILNVPDGTRNRGTGVYSISDLKTETYTTASYVIQHEATIDHGDGTYNRETEVLIHVNDSDPSLNPTSSDSSMELMNGATYTFNDSLFSVDDIYGHDSLLGSGYYTQTKPITDKARSRSYVLLNIFKIEDSDGSVIIRKFGVFLTDDGCDSNDPLITTEAPSESSTTTQASMDWSSTTEEPTSIDNVEPFVLGANNFEAIVQSLNPMRPGHSGKNVDANGDNVSTSTNENPITDATQVVTNGGYLLIDQHIEPLVDGTGNSIGALRKGKYNIRDPATNLSWTGNFDVTDLLLRSTTEGQTVITGSGIFDVILPDGSSRCTTDFKNQANFSIEGHVSVVTDQNCTTSATEIGTFVLTNPTTLESTCGNFVVVNKVSKINDDGSIDIAKAAFLYVDEAAPASEEPQTIPYGGYFLTDQHLSKLPDDEGIYGTGVYNIKDPVTNEYTSGKYVIYNASTVSNDDGTVVATTKGLIYVDTSRSSATSINSHPSLVVIDGAEFTFIDQLSYVPDADGNVHVVGTGVFSQTDPKTNITRSGKYVIKDIINNNNPDGSQDSIQSGIFYYTNESAACDNSPGESINPVDNAVGASPPNSGSDATLSKLDVSLQTLINSLDALKTHTKQLSSPIPTFANVPAAPTPGSDPAMIGSHTPIPSDHVVLPRSNVVSAINGQCLSTGDVVAVKTTTGATLLATIHDSFSPVTFYLTKFPDLTGKLSTATKAWIVPEEDFSKQDRSLFNTVLQSSGVPCST